MKTGLVLEGGAMRGIFTAGVLDVFMEEGLTFDGVIGVSAGAIHGCSYVAGQRGRSIRYYRKYRDDPRFMSFRNLLRTGNMVDTEFCYHEIPDRLDPFDHAAFEASPMKYYCTCTNVETGEAEHILCEELRCKVNYLRASASMPLVSEIVEVDGKKLLDGGVADSIPLAAAYRLGYERNVLVLTRPAEYRKKPDSNPLGRFLYRKYPAFVETMERRAEQYNRTVEEIQKREEAGEIFVIRPTPGLTIGRLGRKPEEIDAAYAQGRRQAQESMEALRRFLKKGEDLL